MNKLAVYVYPLLVFLFVVPTGATENESEPFRIELTSEPAFCARVDIIFQQMIEFVNPHLTEAQAGPIRWQILQHHLYSQLPQEN